MILRIWLSILILLISSVGWADFPRFVPVETQEGGIGQWQELPFGEMRIISCTTGVKNLSAVIGGLQVKLKPEWVMKKPTLKSLSDEFPAWIETPIRPGSGKNTIYQREVFFPSVYVRDPADTKDFELGIQGDFPVCQGDKCMVLPIRMGLVLKADEADYTSMCAYIIDQQMQNPVMAKAQKVEGKSWVENGQLVMVFSGVKAPSIAFLQTPNQDEFQVQETQLEKIGVVMRVKTQPWAIGQEKEWILATNKGIFRVPVKMQRSPVSLTSNPSSKSIWWMGWEFFFLSPFLIWWGLGMTRTNKKWQKDLIKFCLWLPVIFIARLFLLQYVSFDWPIYVVALLGTVCLFPPQKGYMALALFLIWPFFSKMPEMPVGKLIFWGWIVGVEMMIPFVFLYIKIAEVGKVLRELKKKSFFLYNLIFLLPTVYLLGMSVWGLCRSKIPFQNELNKNGVSVVINENEAHQWQKISNISFISDQSMLGQSLLKMYGRKTPMVVWKDQWGHVVLLPDSSVSDVHQFISNWHGYHALYRP